MTVERVEPLKHTLTDVTRHWQTLAYTSEFRRFRGALTYVECRTLAEELTATGAQISVKQLLIDVFDSEDNTLDIEQPLHVLVDELCERVEPLLCEYFSDIINEQSFCIEECTVNNIGLRPNVYGYYEWVILDSGIPNADVFATTLDVHTPII